MPTPGDPRFVLLPNNPGSVFPSSVSVPRWPQGNHPRQQLSGASLTLLDRSLSTATLPSRARSRAPSSPRNVPLLTNGLANLRQRRQRSSVTCFFHISSYREADWIRWSSIILLFYTGPVPFLSLECSPPCTNYGQFMTAMTIVSMYYDHVSTMPEHRLQLVFSSFAFSVSSSDLCCLNPVLF